MSAATETLRSNRRQLDADGVEVGVSRQAIEETLAEYGAMLHALHMVRDANRDEPHIPPTALAVIEAAIAKAEPRS